MARCRRQASPMPEPDEGFFCRFVRRQDWSVAGQRPKPSAFKHKGNVSLWHERRVLDHGDQLHDLQFGPLADTGQAYFRAAEIERQAKEIEAQAKGDCDCSLSMTVEWRPETVSEGWKKWADAHAEIIEAGTNCHELTVRFRRALCTNARRLVAPKPRG